MTPSQILRFLRDYTTLLVLLALGLLLSLVTLARQSPEGAGASKRLAAELARVAPPGARVLIVVRDIPADRELAATLGERSAARAVFIWPGATQLTRIRCSPSSFASARVMP